MALWKRKRPKNKVTVTTGKMVGEVNHAFNEARKRLESVGAPVRDFTEVHVGFKRGTIKTRLGWGYHDKNGQLAGGLTLGRIISLATDPDGGPQHLIWMLEASHTWLRLGQAADYEWMRKAFPEWRAGR